MSVELSDMRVQRPLFMPQEGTIRLRITIAPDTGYFELCEETGVKEVTRSVCFAGRIQHYA